MAVARPERTRPLATARNTIVWVGDVFVDRARERTAALNQLLLTAVVYSLAMLVAVGPFAGDTALFFLGVVVVSVVTGATLVIPWNRLPFGWVAAVPAADMIAITIMQLSSPTSALGLLWIFPAMWLAAGFGLLGLFAVIVADAGLLGMLVAMSAQQVTFATYLLPLVVFAVAATSFFTARRSDAQRTLLAKQARLLGSVLQRTRRQEQELTEVLDAVDFGVIRIAPDGTVAITNEAHGRLQRAGRDDDADTPAYRDDGVTPLPRDELPLERALRGEAFDGQLVWFGPPEGPRRALSVTARRLTESTGADAGAVLVSRDVTRELTALRARDDLVASVSHELRTPLTSILGYLDLVLDDPEVPGRARSKVEIAERNAERLLGIVADILAASSSSSTAVELAIAPERVDVAEILVAAAEAAMPRADAKGVVIDTEGIEPAAAWADSLRIRQVIDNLVSNAIAYNRDEGSVFLSTTTDGQHTWIVVRDTGAGIGEAERTRLFQRYYRAGAARGTGTGLGLAISRDIVRAHGGELAVHSTPGAGSTFIIKLPVTAAEEADAR
ncbi:sensor histidine kinase [Microbacterium awajiense]|uniref:histidine kinase n=1 Tax=Microbacterium awajiense TaxID=415214 RepID=A0ABP7A2U7_9MICO